MGISLHSYGHHHSHGGHSHGGNKEQRRISRNSADYEKLPITHDNIQTGNGYQAGNGYQSYGSLTSALPDEEKASDRENHETSHRKDNINVKAAFIHVLGDLLQSVGVLVAAFIIYFKPEWKLADPICTFLFSVFVVITTLTIMRDILIVLMEGTPRGLDFAEIRQSFYDFKEVRDIHDLRIWSLSMDKTALSVHLAVDKDTDTIAILKQASFMIQSRFDISETTIQIEEYVEEMLDCTHCQDLD